MNDNSELRTRSKTDSRKNIIFIYIKMIKIVMDKISNETRNEIITSQFIKKFITAENRGK